MTDVSDAFYARWKSRKHIGPFRPTHRVLVRHGEFKRGYHHWNGPLVRADIYGESKARPWCPTWTPNTDWVEVPGILTMNFDQDFEQDGTITATITLENVLYREKVGAMGLMYHAIERGGLSPLRGYKGPKGLPFKVPATNEWERVLVENAQVKVYQGYGDALEPVFIGFIDKVSPKAKPDQITIALRDTGGKVLNDEHVFGWNKSKQLPEPVIFRQDTRKGKRVGMDASASSSRDGHPARFVTDTSTKSAWISADRDSADNTEWVQIRLRRGKYSSFILEPGYDGMEVFVGIYAKTRLGEHAGGAEGVLPQYNDEDIPEGWVDLDLGEVPGETDGGWRYVKHYNSASANLRQHRLPGTFQVGDNSILRVGFRRLNRVGGNYRASVVRLQAVMDPKPLTNRNGKPTKVILVQDASDMVRCALRWAGFKDWKVDDTGATLNGNVPFSRASTYMDIIKHVKDSTGFIFYMERPTNADSSLGLPVFRQNTTLKRKVATKRDIIRDTDLLTDLDVSLTDEPKSYIVRVRGRAAPVRGQRLGSDRVKQLMAVYRPPWSGTNMARIIRHHFTHDDPHIKTQRGCEIFARLLALQMALQGATATAVIPGTPQFDLDDQAALLDTGTGTATRLYVVRVSHAFNAGRETQWMTTLGGSLIDNPDVTAVVRELLNAAGDAAEIGKMGDVLSQVE